MTALPARSRTRPRLQAPVRLAGAALLPLLALAALPDARAGVYVTETSGIRWNDVGGIRWNDVGGIRWNDVGGLLFSEASGIRWNEVGGIRWNDVGGVLFDDAIASGLRSVDLELLEALSALPDTSSLNVVVTYRDAPRAADLADLVSLGILGGTIYRRLPMVAVNATKPQIAAVAALPAVRSVYAERTLSFFDAASLDQIGAAEAASDPDLRLPDGSAPTGSGITIAVLDTGVDATHPDLPWGSKVVENVRLLGTGGTAIGFAHPVALGGLADTDLVLGHGTAVASVAAGTGAGGGGLYAGVAPGAKVLGLSAGDVSILQVLEGFDYVLDNAARLGVRVVNCSWGTLGWFDPDDPVNVATRLLHDAGIVVVFAAGNHGPAPDTLNRYAVAPWVIGVGSTDRRGALSEFSSRGIFEELIYHPTIVAPGEKLVAALASGLPAILGVTGVADPAGGASVPPEHAPLYAPASGTSFAAPHAAGLAALMLESDPALTPAAIKRILMATATPILARDRSEVGAGRLDAWAALTQARDPARPFGTHVPGWLDARPYRIEHRPAVEAAAVVPAGGTASVPVSAAPGALSWQLTVAWGTLPGPSDLDVRVVDASGIERARSSSFNGTSLFGRAEGVHLLGALPGDLTLEVSFKAGAGLLDQPFLLRGETAAAVVTAYSDVAALPEPARALVTRAVSRNYMVGRGARFEAGEPLRRGELARALALAAGLPQRIPSAPSFPDVGLSDPEHPYVESVAGARARRILMQADGGSAFQPRAAVSRLDFAVAMVRAAGLAAEADARAGEELDLEDQSKIPDALRGYAAVALERGFIGAVLTSTGALFDPKGSLSRLEAACRLHLLLDPAGGGPC